MSFICSVCEKCFANANKLKQHSKLHCELCNKFFINTTNLKKHMTNCNVFCSVCNENVPKKYYSHHKRTHEHRSKESTIYISEKVKLRTSAFSERIESYTYTNDNSLIIFPEEFFKEAQETIIKLLEECRAKHSTYKFNMELECDYLKIISSSDSGQTQKDMSIGHVTKMCLVTLADDLQELFELHSKDICTKMSEFQERDSGWSLTRINCLNLNINQVRVFRGSAFIPLPLNLTKKPKALLNLLNSDDYCFKWCVIASFFKDSRHSINELRHPQTYQIADISSDLIVLNTTTTLNFSRMSFPLMLKDIKIFEQNNNISVNVFGYDNDAIVGPYYLTKDEKANHINLLLLTKEDKSHYILIRDMSR